MECLFLFSILLLTIVGSVIGRLVNFNLLTFGNEVTVTFGNETISMAPVDDYSKVYGAFALCPNEEFRYYYTVDGKTEGFSRTLEPETATTHNEFFGRKHTIKPLKGMGYPPEKPQWTRSIGKTTVFDDSYIPTIILDEGSSDFFINGYDTYTLGRFTMVLKDEIFTETNVPTKAQNRYEDKFQWRVKLENKIHKRKIFKFRANAVDPAFFRQNLYGDMAAAVGNPVHNQVICRVYLSNGTPIGLYTMIEVTSSKSFIKSQFYGNEATEKITVPPTQLGYPLDCSTGADFIPGGSLEPFKFDEGETNERVRYLTDAMHNVNVYDEVSVQEFNKNWFDLDVFFRSLALEYLTGDWDSYWMYTCNYVLYDAPDESTENSIKYYFIDQDFDLTFGIGLSHQINFYGHEFPSQSYKTLVDRTWNVSSKDPHSREAIDIFLRGGITTTMFENHLIDIVKHVFNPVALGRRLNEYVERYTDDIKWDYTINRIHIANNPNHTRYVFTMDDYYKNLKETPIKSAEWGLMEWIKMRSRAVAKEFGFEWDEVPLDPPPKQYLIEDLENEDDDEEEMEVMSNLNISSTEENSSMMTIKMINLSFIFIVFNSLIFGFLI